MKDLDKFKLKLKKKAFWKALGDGLFFYSIFVIFIFLFLTAILFWKNQAIYFPELANKIKLTIWLTLGWLMVLSIGIIKRLK